MDEVKQLMESTDGGGPTEVPRKWGFRRSTIAKREFMEEIGNVEKDVPPRRGARQARGRGRGGGRGRQAGDTPVPSTSVSKRGRGGRRSAPAKLDATPDNLQTSHDADAESVAGMSLDEKVQLMPTQGGVERVESVASSHQPLGGEVTAQSDPFTVDPASESAPSDPDADSDELTVQELQLQTGDSHKLEECRRTTEPATDSKSGCVTENVVAGPVVMEEQQPLSTFKPEATKPEGPSLTSRLTWALSRSAPFQKAQKRAACERKMARNIQDTDEEEEGEKDEESNGSSEEESEESDSEDYNPNAVYCICRQKHNKRFMICCDRCQEWFHGDCVGISEARGRLLEKNGEDYICTNCSPTQSPMQNLKKPLFSSACLSSYSGEDKPISNEGIKGKIQKASNQGLKRKIKISQRVEEVVAVEEEEVAESKSSLPLCIGPSCGNSALPESVYCSHECILQHAAATMQSLSEPRAKPDAQDGPRAKPGPKGRKKSLPGRPSQRKLTEPVGEKEVAEVAAGVGEQKDTEASSVTAVPEKKPVGPQTSSIASSLFYKLSSVIKKRESKGCKKEPDTPQTPPHASSAPPPDGDAEEKSVVAPPARKPGAAAVLGRAKKTMPGSPRFVPVRQLLTGAPQGDKITCTSPKEETQSPAVSTTSPPPVSTPTTEAGTLLVTPAPLPPTRPLPAHPNIQIRQNIRRSLTDMLLKRLADSEGLEMSESNVGKLALNIEREMFNMYFTTDNKYRTKYRSLILNLKDPKNKGLFYKVIKGGISPFKLTRLSQQELQATELWDDPGDTEDPASDPPRKVALKGKPPPSAHFEDAKSGPEGIGTQTRSVGLKASSSISSTSDATPNAGHSRPAQPKKINFALPDAISSMLKDTTSEHRAHLFDLKCRICTGQMSADEEPESQKPMKEEPKEEEKQPSSWMIPVVPGKPAQKEKDVSIMESPASPVQEDSQDTPPVPDFIPVVIPAVSTVSITRRDPRKAGHRPAHSSDASLPVAPAQASVPTSKETDTLTDAKAFQPLLAPPPLPLPPPKSILMKPSSTSVSGFLSSSGSSSRLVASDSDDDRATNRFLSKQNTVWKGFLNMQTVAKFVTKGYLISGAADLLKDDMPDTIHIGGRILPQTVWEYVDRVKTSVTKELCMIRFHPATDEEEVAYVSLFSYFNSRRRFGVVSNICNHIKDLYLIPLSATESIPSMLLPLDGPGLEDTRPNLLIGLAICQKSKRPGASPQGVEEKKPKIEILEEPQKTILSNLPTPPQMPKVDIRLYGSQSVEQDIPVNKTPPGSPPPIRSPDSDSSSSCSLSSRSALTSILSAIKPPGAPAKDKVPHESTDNKTDSNGTPLQTILNTLFRKKTQEPSATEIVSESGPSIKKDPDVISTPQTDPIVQQFNQTQKGPAAEMVLDDDRPYDPEEEYKPVFRYGTDTPMSPTEDFEARTLPAVDLDDNTSDDRPYDPEEEYNTRGCPMSSIKVPESKILSIKPSISDDVAYDPEDETVFEEIRSDLTSKKKSSVCDYSISPTATLSEQQQMLEDLNRQIEEQKRQLEAQQEALRLQRAAVGISMAHFSVSDALMSPPGKTSLENCEVFPFGSGTEEKAQTPDVTVIHQSGDPWQNIKDTKFENEVKLEQQQILTQVMPTSANASLTLSVKDRLQSKSNVLSVKQEPIMDSSEVDQCTELAKEEKELMISHDQLNITNKDCTNTNIIHLDSIKSAETSCQSSQQQQMSLQDTESPSKTCKRRLEHCSTPHHEEIQDRRSSHSSKGDVSRSPRRARSSPGHPSRRRSDSQDEIGTTHQRHRQSPRPHSKHRSHYSHKGSRHHHRNHPSSPKRESSFSRGERHLSHQRDRRSLKDQAQQRSSKRQRDDPSPPENEHKNKPSSMSPSTQKSNEEAEHVHHSKPHEAPQPPQIVHETQKVSVAEDGAVPSHVGEEPQKAPKMPRDDLPRSKTDLSHQRDQKPSGSTLLKQDFSKAENEQFHQREQSPIRPPQKKGLFHHRDKMPSRSNHMFGGEFVQPENVPPDHEEQHTSGSVQIGSNLQAEGYQFRQRHQPPFRSPHVHQSDVSHSERQLFHQRGQPRPPLIQSAGFAEHEDDFDCTDQPHPRPSQNPCHDFAHVDADHFHDRAQSSGTRPLQRGRPKFLQQDDDHFHHGDHPPFRPPHMHRNDFPHLENEYLHQRSQPQSKPNSMQRGSFIQHEDEQFNRVDKPLARPSHNLRDDFEHPERDHFHDRGRSFGPSTTWRENFSQQLDHLHQGDQPPIISPQIQRGDFPCPESDQIHSGNHLNPGPQSWNRGDYPQNEEDPYHHRDKPTLWPSQMQRGDLSQPEDQLFLPRDQYHQREQPGPPPVQRGNFAQHEHGHFHHGDQPPQRHSQRPRDEYVHPEDVHFYEREQSMLHHRDHPAQRPQQMKHCDFSCPDEEEFPHCDELWSEPSFTQRDDFPKERVGHLHPTEQFGPRGPHPSCSSQWREPLPKFDGPRGPNSMFIRGQRGPPPFQPRGPRANHPRMFQGPGSSENMAPRFPSPRLFEGPGLPQCSDGQNDSCQPRHSGPRFRHPQPKSSVKAGGPLRRPFDNNGPQPHHLEEPRGCVSPQQCDTNVPPLLETPRGFNDQQRFSDQEMVRQREPTPPQMVRRSQGCPQGPLQKQEHRGEHRGGDRPHSAILEEQFEVGQGSEIGRQMGGLRFGPAQNVRGQMAQSGQRMKLPLNRPSFDNQNRAQSPGFHNQDAPPVSQLNRPRGPSPGQFQCNRRQPRFPNSEPHIRPLRFSGPLLPTPTEGPIPMWNPRMQGPETHQEAPWPEGTSPVGRYDGFIMEDFDQHGDAERFSPAERSANHHLREDVQSPICGRQEDRRELISGRFKESPRLLRRREGRGRVRGASRRVGDRISVRERKGWDGDEADWSREEDLDRHGTDRARGRRRGRGKRRDRLRVRNRVRARSKIGADRSKSSDPNQGRGLDEGMNEINVKDEDCGTKTDKKEEASSTEAPAVS